MTLATAEFDAANVLRQLVAQSIDWMAVFDSDRRYCAMSPALEAILAVSHLPVKERTILELAEVAEGLNPIDPWCRYWRQVENALLTVQQQRKAERRIQFLPIGEAMQPCETTYTPLMDEDGHVRFIVSLSRPTTTDSVRFRPQKPLTDVQLETYPEAIVGVEMPTPTQQAASASSGDSAIAPVPSRREPLSAGAMVCHLPMSGSSSAPQTPDFMQIVLDNIPQYIFWKDRNSVYLGCNRCWAEMAGFNDPSEVVGITDADLPWSEEERAWYLQCDRQVMETDTPMLRIKESQLQADGRLSWRETSKLPLHDPEGNVIGLLGTIEDITDRKLAEDLLKQSEEMYRAIAEREELLNRVSNQIRQSLTLEDIQEKTVKEVRECFGVDRMLIYRFDSDWHGEVVTEAVVGDWRSLRNQQISDNCFPNAYAAMYLEGRVRAISDIETADIDECHRQFLRDLQVRANIAVPVIVQDELWGLLIAHHCSKPREWQETEVELLRAMAGQVSIALQQAELYSQARESAKIAKQKAAQLELALQTLQQTQSQLVQTEKLSGLGQMVAGIAHEINNPVNFIYGNIPHIKEYVHDLTELIELYREHHPNPAPEIAEFIEEVDLDYLVDDLNKILKSFQMGSQRIQQIVSSLRTFSRLDEADKKPVDIHEGIDSTLLILQHRFKAKPNRPEIQIHKRYADLPPVECYPSQLNQVFMNLLSNAVDAIEQEILSGARAHKSDKARVQIITEKCDGEVLIRIQDNGPGIPEKYHNKLFDPFFTTKPIGKGTGLGLSISHQIITEKHSGRLLVNSEEGSGTEFLIFVPLK